MEFGRVLKQIFISYRHEGEAHGRAVRRLGERLRELGLPVMLDQFYCDDHPGGPDVGWPRWCEENAAESACVLIIGSPGWFSAYELREPPHTGQGAAAEAAHFRQSLYDSKGNNSRIRIAFVDSCDPAIIPERLRPWHQFKPFEQPKDLERLIRWAASLTQVECKVPPGVAWPAATPYVPSIANRDQKEWPAVVDLLSGQSAHRVLLVQGPSGIGKSTFLGEALAYARSLSIDVVRVDFRRGRFDVADILGEFQIALESKLPELSAPGGCTSYVLRKALRQLRTPVLVVLDACEAANDYAESWICDHLLSETEASKCLCVILAGQVLPDSNLPAHCKHALRLTLGPIRDVGHWESWLARHYPHVLSEALDLRTLIRVTGGSPLMMRTLVEGIAKSE